MARRDRCQLPEGAGINITISYGILGNGLDNSYNYSVAHMRADGTIENLPATNGESGITFHVNSLSPFAIGWYKNTPTPGGGGGGGGGGAVSTCTLTFDTNGGSAIDKITKDSGTTIDLAAYKPTRAGYTFAGWFSDKALTKAVTSVKLTANTTVYAKWTQNGGTAQNPFVDVKEGAYYYDAVLVGRGAEDHQRYLRHDLQPRCLLHPRPDGDVPVAGGWVPQGREREEPLR